VARRAVDRAAVPDLRAVVFRAAGLRAVVLRAVVLRAVALRVVGLRAVALRVVALRVVALRAGLAADLPPPDTAFSSLLALLRALFNHEALPLRTFAGRALICFSIASSVLP
jgi:hypothetical protein